MSIALKKILLPTDFSEASYEAFPYAMSLAQKFGASIVLAYVVPTSLPAELSHIGIVLEEMRLAKEAETTLARVRSRQLPADLTVETVVLGGGPFHQISETARARAIDLIVMSTRGHTGLKHALIGSTCERVVRHAPCPVLTVRERPVRIRFPDDVPCRFKSILVPMDFSDASTRALHYALELAASCNAQIKLLHVIEPSPYPRFGHANVPTRKAQARRIAHEGLRSLACESPAVERVVESTLVRSGLAQQEIVAEADAQNIDLIVIATRGYTGLKHAWFGSTAERVVRHAPCPVLVVREREHDFLQERGPEVGHQKPA